MIRCSVPGEFSWSVSRHDSFARCARRYYYAYYAAPEDPEIQRLKRLSALPLWAGSVVHETIEELLKTHDTVPAPEEQEAIVRAAVHSRMLSEWRESEAGSPRFRLFEHEYEQPVEAEDKKILVGTVMRSLRNFFASPTLNEAYAAGRQNWLSVEDLVSFEFAGVPVLLRMDLAFRDREGRVVDGVPEVVEVPGDALALIERWTHAAGIEIDAETNLTDWDGSPVDYDAAVSAAGAWRPL